MIREASKTFEENLDSFVQGVQKKPLLAISRAETLRKTLKEFALTHGYTHKSVLALELDGFNTISALMDMFWFSITAMAGKTLDEQKQTASFRAICLYANLRELSSNL